MNSDKAIEKAGDWRVFAAAGYSIIFITFGIMGGWAAIAKVDRAVVATGYVSVETNRKTLQHLEGGIVRQIYVKEGDHVHQGQLLIRLEKLQAQANFDAASGQLLSALALESRLIAERDSAENIQWPAEFTSSQKDPTIAKLMDDQQAQFLERKETLNGQISIIEQKKKQLETEIQGIDIERDSTQRQVEYINKELVGLRELLKKQLVPTNRVYATERERTKLEGGIGKLISDKAKAQTAIKEMDVQIAQTRQKFNEDVATTLLEVRQKLNDYKQKHVVANDVLKRVDLTSPRDGVIQNLKVFTLGQVLKPGEPLLDIVPDDELLIVQAQFQPQDIDVVHAGQNAEIRFPAFHSRTLPMMAGTIETLSNDRMMDEALKQPYYLGTISIAKSEIPDEYRTRLRAGMPAEVIVAAGERTVMDYLISPISSAIRKTFIEQ